MIIRSNMKFTMSIRHLISALSGFWAVQIFVIVVYGITYPVKWVVLVTIVNAIIIGLYFKFRE